MWGSLVELKASYYHDPTDCLQEQQLPGTPVDAPLWPAVIGKGDSLSLPGCEGPQDAAASWDGSTFVQDLCLIVYFLIIDNSKCAQGILIMG